MMFKLKPLLLLSGALNISIALAQSSDTAGTIEIRSKAENITGIANSGSEGIVSGLRIAALPILRPGEVMEMVPGLIVTQHAGDG